MTSLSMHTCVSMLYKLLAQTFVCVIFARTSLQYLHDTCVQRNLLLFKTVVSYLTIMGCSKCDSPAQIASKCSKNKELYHKSLLSSLTEVLTMFCCPLCVIRVLLFPVGQDTCLFFSLPSE